MTPGTAEWRVLQQVSEELREAGVDIPADTLAWARDRVDRLLAVVAQQRSNAEVRRRAVEHMQAHRMGGREGSRAS